ncbi:MAG: flagellar motor protein MotB [bacterium]
MLKKIVFLMTITSFCLSINGCGISKTTYLKKVQEAEYLKQSSEEKDLQIEDLKKQVTDSEIEKVKLRKREEEKALEAKRTYNDMLKKMEQEIAQGQIKITELKGKLTLNMLDSILFDSGQVDIKSGGLEVLTKVIDILKQAEDKAIRIEGHTDNVPIRGALQYKYPTNWELSASRAINVAKYLQDQGIDPSNLSPVAFGEYKPVASNETEEGRAQNRRIEIVLVPKE